MNLYLNADCMNPETGLPSYPGNYFDLAIVDPPYGIGADKMTLGNGKREIHRGNWDSQPPSDEYFAELFRVSKNQIVWGANHFISRIAKDSSCWVFWDKGTGDNDFADGELAWTSFGSVTKKVFISWVGANAKEKSQTSRIHITQKPIALYRWLLKNYAKQGDLILDTHVGSASSLVVFEEMGFEYVGYELDTDYYRDSCKRLEAFRAQPKLFTGKEIFEASKPPTLF